MVLRGYSIEVHAYVINHRIKNSAQLMLGPANYICIKTFYQRQQITTKTMTVLLD